MRFCLPAAEMARVLLGVCSEYSISSSRLITIGNGGTGREAEEGYDFRVFFSRVSVWSEIRGGQARSEREGLNSGTPATQRGPARPLLERAERRAPQEAHTVV